MRIAAIDRIEAPGQFSGLPLNLKQHSATLPACALVLVSGLSIAALMLPVVLIAMHSLTDARLAAVVIERPLISAGLLAGLLLAVCLMLLPFRAGLLRMRQCRDVRLAHDTIMVEDHSLFGLSRWHAPISQFAGVTHHIRATLSGPRHEIILVHRDRSKDVLLNLGARSPEHGAEQFARWLGLDVIHASVLYGRRNKTAAQLEPNHGLQPVTA